MRPNGMNRRKACILYLNHALSAWNARSYGFAAFLFTAAAYPKGLRAASLIGISTSLTAICFGSAIGRWIDNGPSRLRTLLTTIAINRCSILAACVLWYFIVGGQNGGGDSLLHGTMKTMTFGVLLLLGVIESLSRNANVISIERDWVPVLAPVVAPSGYNLAHVNAMMARIDMSCKLIGPIAVSGVLSVIPIREGVMAMALINSISFVAEFWSASQLWNQCPELAEKKMPDLPAEKESFVTGYINGLKLYFGSSAGMPSLAMCVTHASILSVTSVTVVFLLHSGYSLRLVTVGEALSAVFELSSTVLVPLRVQKVSRRLATMAGYEFSAIPQDEDDAKPESPAVAIDEQSQYVDTAIAHVGRTGILTMAFTLLPTVPILLYLTHVLQYPIQSSESPTLSSYPIATVVLFVCLAASRQGRGMLYLSNQQLAQSRLPSHQRSSFAGAEHAFERTFSLLHGLGTAIWSKPSQFGWLALASWIMIANSAAIYLSWWMNENVKRRPLERRSVSLHPHK